jgi:16S rRNA (uracil1498-N3)-methyltransferase
MVRNSNVRLFVKNTLVRSKSIELTHDAAHYVTNVMRLGVGDSLTLFNGRDGEWEGLIQRAERKSTIVNLMRLMRSQTVEPDVWMAVAPIKRTRMEYLIEKVTELGVTRILPVTTRRSVVSRINVERLRLRAIEAAEQCGRLSIPDIAELQQLERFLETLEAGSQVVWCDESGESPAIVSMLPELLEAGRKGPWVLLIGPEGGFNHVERKLLSDHTKVMGIHLSPYVLRSETAATVVLGIFQALILNP